MPNRAAAERTARRLVRSHRKLPLSRLDDRPPCGRSPICSCSWRPHAPPTPVASSSRWMADCPPAMRHDPLTNGLRSGKGTRNHQGVGAERLRKIAMAGSLSGLRATKAPRLANAIWLLSASGTDCKLQCSCALGGATSALLALTRAALALRGGLRASASACLSCRFSWASSSWRKRLR